VAGKLACFNGDQVRHNLVKRGGRGIFVSALCHAQAVIGLEGTRIISSSMEITKLSLGKRTPVPAMTVIAVWLHLRSLRRIRRSRHSRDRGHQLR